MKLYYVEITETFAKSVRVLAENKDDAEDKVYNLYSQCRDFSDLDYRNHISSEIKVSMATNNKDEIYAFLCEQEEIEKKNDKDNI